MVTRGQQRFRLRHRWIDAEGAVRKNLCLREIDCLLSISFLFCHIHLCNVLFGVKFSSFSHVGKFKSSRKIYHRGSQGMHSEIWHHLVIQEATIFHLNCLQMILVQSQLDLWMWTMIQRQSQMKALKVHCH